MKQLFSILLLVALSLNVWIHNSESYEVKYEVRFRRDSNVNDYKSEIAQLFITDNQSLFASESKLTSDSIAYLCLDETNHRGTASQRYVIFKDYNEDSNLDFEGFAV